MIRGVSISTRLTLWFSSILLAGLMLFGIVMRFNLERTLMVGRSRTLDRRADRLGDLLRDLPDSGAQRAGKFQAFADATGGGLMQVFFPTGILALPSPSAAGSFPWPRFSPREGLEEVTQGTQTYLVLTRPLSTDSANFVMRIAAPLEGNRPILHAFSVGLLWTVPALLMLSALGGYFISRKALKPVGTIIAATNRISVTNLSERLPVPGSGDELQRLSETHNAMLARLETAVNEIQRFTADASHELRGPLAFVRTVAEVALKNRDVDAASRKAFAEIVEECGKASRVLEDMLTLARAGAGNANLAFEPVDLAELAATVCEKARQMPSASQRSIASNASRDFNTIVWADYTTLRRLLWIVIENAVKYTHPGGRVSVNVTGGPSEVTITIEDDGIGISRQDLPLIFERFYRADPSRSKVEGTGLGLAIARWIANAHHARISVESRENAGSVFHVVFPAFRALANTSQGESRYCGQERK